MFPGTPRREPRFGGSHAERSDNFDSFHQFSSNHHPLSLSLALPIAFSRMSSPQAILPHSSTEHQHASDTSSDIDEKLSAHDDLEGKKDVALAAPRREGAEAAIAYNEDGEVVGFEEGIGAVGLSWYKKGPALLFILLFVCERRILPSSTSSSFAPRFPSLAQPR